METKNQIIFNGSVFQADAQRADNIDLSKKDYSKCLFFSL